MDWFEIALQNPVENWPVWFILAMGILRIIEFGVRRFSDIQRDNVVLMRDMQQNTSEDNTLQSRLIDEMTARRVSDEKFKMRLAAIVDETLLRIDGTTRDTNTKATSLVKETRRTQAGLKLLYEELKKQGVLK